MPCSPVAAQPLPVAELGIRVAQKIVFEPNITPLDFVQTMTAMGSFII
jgi:hypothetical protein